MARWTDPELAVVRELYPTMTVQHIGQMLGRTAKSVQRLAQTLKLRKEVHAPRNWRPIGSERMDKGILIRKVTDTGQPKKDWKRVDVIEWEAINGPVPPGKLLILIDPAKPRTPDNLGLFTHEEHFARVTVQNLPPEVMQLCQLKGQITQAINRWEKKAQAEPSPPSECTS